MLHTKKILSLLILCFSAISLTAKENELAETIKTLNNLKTELQEEIQRESRESQKKEIMELWKNEQSSVHEGINICFYQITLASYNYRRIINAIELLEKTKEYKNELKKYLSLELKVFSLAKKFLTTEKASLQTIQEKANEKMETLIVEENAQKLSESMQENGVFSWKNSKGIPNRIDEYAEGLEIANIYCQDFQKQSAESKSERERNCIALKSILNEYAQKFDIAQ